MYFIKRISAMEKGQCPTVATWESGNVRSRKTTPTATTPGQVIVQSFHFNFILYSSLRSFRISLRIKRRRYRETVARHGPVDDKACYRLPGRTSTPALRKSCGVKSIKCRVSYFQRCF